MKQTYKIAGAVVVLFGMSLADIPYLSVKLVPEAQAWRGRGAAFVVGAAVGSARSSSAEASAAAAQQQAAAAQQQAAAAQQQAAAAQQQAAAAQQQAAAAQQQAPLQLPPGSPCRWAPSFPPSPQVAPRKWSAAWSTMSAATTSIVRRFRGAPWCM